MKNCKGVSLAVLTITIIVLIIIVTITVKYSINVISESKLEDLKTNMLLIKAKGKTWTEEYSFKVANLNAQKEEDKAKIEAAKQECLKGVKYSECSSDVKSALNNTGIQNVESYYYLSLELLKENGINIKINNGEYYFIMYDVESGETEIVNTLGYSKNGQKYYSLTQLLGIDVH